MAVTFIGGGNRSTRKKSTDLSQVTDKLYHIILYISRFEPSTLVVIGTDCIGKYKNTCHTITTAINLELRVLDNGATYQVIRKGRHITRIFEYNCMTASFY